MKRQLSRQMFVRKLLFLVCCFFSVIWIIFFEDKMNIKMPKWIFCKVLGNYFWNLGTPVFIFLNVFIIEIYLTNNWRFINCRRKRTLLMTQYMNLMYYASARKNQFQTSKCCFLICFPSNLDWLPIRLYVTRWTFGLFWATTGWKALFCWV